MTFGIGNGRYWSDRLRTDLAIDWVRQQTLFSGFMDYPTSAGDVTASIRDTTAKESGVVIANAYLDFGVGEHRRFTPYIAAGVGLAVNILDRNSYVSQDTYESTANNKSTTVSFAAAMVGFAYDLARAGHRPRYRRRAKPQQDVV